MTDKQLKKLSRAELLEMLLLQTNEVRRLTGELEQAKAQLEDRRMTMQEAGNIAEATVGLNQIFRNAQKTADEYLEHIRQMEAETAEKCRRMEAQTQEKCDAMLADARNTARQFWTKLQYEVRDYQHWKMISDIIEGRNARAS